MTRRCDLNPGDWFRYGGDFKTADSRRDLGHDGYTLFQCHDHVLVVGWDGDTARQRQVYTDRALHGDRLGVEIDAYEVRYYVVYPCDPPSDDDATRIRFSLIELE